MSIRGTSQELYVGEQKSTIITFWSKKKVVNYKDLKRIVFMYSSKSEMGFLSFFDFDNQEIRFEFGKNANEKISKTIDLIKENMPNLEIVEQHADDLKFYQRNLFVIISSFVLGCPLGVIGLYLMWHYKKNHIAGRLIITFMVFCFWGVSGYLTYARYISAMDQASSAIINYGNAIAQEYPQENHMVNNGEKENAESSELPKYENVYGASTYKVGKDIPPGEYVLFSDNEDINYYQVSSDSSNTITSILANGSFKTNTIVTVESGQYFNFMGCHAVPISEANELNTSQEGMFKIGVHLAPGEYQLWKSENADISYYAVSKDSTHSTGSIKTNGILEEREYITVEKGEYLELQGCYIIE